MRREESRRRRPQKSRHSSKGVDLLQAPDVEYLHPSSMKGISYESTLSKPNRVVTGDARHAYPADAAMGTTAWLQHQPGDPDQLQRGAAGRYRLALPGAASAGAPEMDQFEMDNFYRPTAAGKKQLAAERSRWAQLTEAVEGILNPARKESKA